jgi:hypothetical protein
MLGFLDRLLQHGASVPPVELAGPSQVRGYWEALRVGTSLPSRAALDPRGLGGVLDRVFLAERIGTGLVQVRVAGSALAELAGTELKGLPLSCLFTPESRPLLAQAVEEVFADPAVVEIDLGSDRGRTGLAIARLVLLPLQDEGDCRQLLGVFGLAEGARAGKMQILGRRSESLTVPEPQPAPLAEPEPRPEPLRRHGHLRLVHFSAE